jgi:imidazolonepropionase
MQQIDLLIHSAAQAATCAAPDGPKRGAALADAGLIHNAALAIHDGRIVEVGDSDALRARYTARQSIDAGGKALCPGLVDCHTHTVYGGDRVHEFELRIQGASYMEIMAAGGGIVSTMRHTRLASEEALVESATQRLDAMLALGSTTVEIKTGYGLDTAGELKMLRVIEQLARTHVCDIVPTFLGAHAVPPEYAGDAEGYCRLVIEEMLPAVAAWRQSSVFAETGAPCFIDVFCEDHAFDVAQSERILQAGLDAGLAAKIHVDQFHALGGLSMAARLGVTSADHLDVSRPDEIDALARTEAAGVPLPAATFNLGGHAYANARGLIERGVPLALATDLNPGSAPCPSLPLVMAIACRYQRLLPAEALNACTINAAHALALGDRIGSLEAGKQADVLILKEGDYRHLAYFFGDNPVETVIKRGSLVRVNG